jgi:hypothetical protein
MDTSAAFNVITIAVAFGALIVSLFFAMRQTGIMRQSNQLPVFVDMVREFRSEEFQRYEQYILRDLGPNNNPELGVMKLPDEARLAVLTIQSFFGTLATLITEGFISEEAAVLLLGYRANELWEKLEPFVIGEREIRGNGEFSCYYEDFVCRIRAAQSPGKTYGPRLKSLPHLAAAVDKLSPVIGPVDGGSV